MPNLFEELRARQGARRADAEARYRAAVRAAAEGTELDPDDVLDLLTELNRDAAQFADDTQRAADRMALRAKLASVPQRREALEKLQREATAEAKAFAPVAKAHREKMLLLHHQAERAKQELREAEGAQRELYESCNDPELRARENGLRVAIEQLTAQQLNHKRMLDNNRALLDTAIARNKKSDTGLYDEDVGSAQAVVENNRKKLAELDAEMARLVAAREANDEAMRAV